MFISIYKMRLRSILIIVALAAVVMAGVVTALRRPGRPYSTVFQRFDPAAIFSIHPGVSVDAVTGTGSFNFSSTKATGTVNFTFGYFPISQVPEWAMPYAWRKSHVIKVNNHNRIRR
jgi:hypothetical protein